MTKPLYKLFTTLKEENTVDSSKLEKPVQCFYKTCKETFVDIESLKKHELLHYSEKLFKCHYQNCDKTFPNICRLRVHERVHTGYRPFACNFPGCGRKFNEKGNLKTHLRIHTGEKPYKCTIKNCGLTFRTFGYLKFHEKNHYVSNIKCCNCENSVIPVNTKIQTNIVNKALSSTESSGNNNDALLDLEVSNYLRQKSKIVNNDILSLSQQNKFSIIPISNQIKYNDNNVTELFNSYFQTLITVNLLNTYKKVNEISSRLSPEDYFNIMKYGYKN